jgi:hypothetical protein
MRIENGQPVPEYRVTALYYRLHSEVDSDRFDQAADVAATIGPFNCTLSAGLLRAVPTSEFQDREAAKAAVEALLRDWEQSAFLGSPGHRIKFAYERSEVEEINPVPGFKFAFAESALGFGSVLAAAVISRNNVAYPPPNPSFRRNPVTDRLAERLRRVRDREAELTAAAYFVLSTLEQELGEPVTLADRQRQRWRSTVLSLIDSVIYRLELIQTLAGRGRVIRHRFPPKRQPG